MAPFGVLGRWGIVRPRHVEQGNVKSDFRFGIEEEFFVVNEESQLLEPTTHEKFLATAKKLSDGAVTREEAGRLADARFPLYDRNRDGWLAPAEMEAVRRGAPDPSP